MNDSDRNIDESVIAEIVGKPIDFGWLSENAPAIVLVFVDLLVAIAEVRVFDVAMRLTGSPWKAIGFVALSAVPFYLGQILWGYKLANSAQRVISILYMAGGVIYAAVMGRYDLLLGYVFFDEAAIVASAAWLTPIYVSLGLFFAFADEVVRTNARTAIIVRRAEFQRAKNAALARALRAARAAQQERSALRQEHGDNVDAFLGVRPRRASGFALDGDFPSVEEPEKNGSQPPYRRQ